MTPVMHLIFFVLAGAAITPLLRLCLHPKFARAFPRVVFSFGAAILAYLAVLTLTVFWQPALLVWFAAAACTEGVILIWRSRPAYGARRNLPPGSLAILPLEPWINRKYFAHLSDRYGPIFKTSHFFHPMVCIMNLELGLDLLKEHDDVRLRSPKVVPDRFMPCGFLRGMEPERHKLYRRLVQSLITPEVVSVWEKSIPDDTAAVLAGLAAHSDGVYAKPAWDDLLFVSFSRLFFGVIPGSVEFLKLKTACSLTSQVTGRLITVPWLPSERRIEKTLQDLCSLLQQHESRHTLLSELRRQHPEYATDQQMLRLLIFLLIISINDMVGLTQWIAKTLCDFPEAPARLRAELNAGVSQSVPDSLADRMLLETLRRNQVEHLYRRVLDDIEWRGFRIPKGWLVRICLAEAHRNASIFPQPDQFKPERFLEAPPPQKQFLPFGAFRRSCIGESVVRTFGRQFLCTWAQGWDCRQVGESHEEYAGWHWTPGSDFRFVLTPSLRAMQNSA
jgi:cytochrome P450